MIDYSLIKRVNELQSLDQALRFSHKEGRSSDYRKRIYFQNIFNGIILLLSLVFVYCNWWFFFNFVIMFFFFLCWWSILISSRFVYRNTRYRAKEWIILFVECFIHYVRLDQTKGGDFEINIVCVINCCYIVMKCLNLFF